MHDRHAVPARTSHIGLVFAAVTALFLFATPADAADREHEGWFVALDFAQSQPDSLDQHFANRLDTATERLVIDNESAASWRGSFGYGFGKGLGRLQVSYWTFDNDESQQEDPNGGTFYGTLFGGATYTYYSGVSISTTDPIEATSDVKARTFDLDYVRPLTSGDKLTINWLVGLRHATYEEEVGWESIPNPAIYFQQKTIDSRGTGIRFGINSVLGITKHFSLDGGMAISVLQSKIDADGSDSNGSDLGASDDNVRGEIREFDVRALWDYGPLDYYVGYRASTWDGLVADPLLGGDAPFNTGSRGRDSLSFNGVHAGVVYRFGRK